MYTERFAAFNSLMTLVSPEMKNSLDRITESLEIVTPSANFLISSIDCFGALPILCLMLNNLSYVFTSVNLDSTEVSSDLIRTFCVDCVSNVAFFKAEVTAPTMSRPAFDARYGAF